MKSLFPVISSFFRLVNNILIKGKNNIHLVNDEKFIDFAIREFNEAGDNRHLFLIVGKQQKLKFIKSPLVVFIHPRVFWHLLPAMKWSLKSIFFHSLSSRYYKNLISRIPGEVPIFWMSWGFDLIEVFDDARNYIKSKTLAVAPKNIVLRENDSKKFSIKDSPHELSENKKMVERIDFISTVMEDENRIINTKLFSKVPKWVPWNYFTMEKDVIFGFEEKVVIGNNILLGNSGNFWNNHLDAFDDLLLFPFHFEKIICPLSYGDLEYRNQIQQTGSEIFGKNFIPLNDFLEYSEYVKHIVSCQYFFINSKRQLGLGNLLLLLYLGSKVILDRTNPVYDFFTKNEIRVFHIEEAKAGPLKNIDLSKSRSNLIRIWGKDAIRKKSNDLISLFN